MLQEGKLCMFCGFGVLFTKCQGVFQLVMRKKGIQKVLVRSPMSLYEGVRTKSQLNLSGWTDLRLMWGV